MTVNTATPDYIVDGVLTDGEAWVALASTVVSGGSTALITFETTTGANAWSQYMDLVLVHYTKVTNASSGMNYLRLKLNSSSSDFLFQEFRGNGGSAEADKGAYAHLGFVTNNTPADTFTAGWTTFSDINSGKFKAFQTYSSDVAHSNFYVVEEHMSVWEQTAPITRIDVHEGNNYNFTAGSRFDLYGVLPRMVTA
jgi:hypothetical protein